MLVYCPLLLSGEFIEIAWALERLLKHLSFGRFVVHGENSEANQPLLRNASTA